MKLGTRVFIFIYIYIYKFGEFFILKEKITLSETKISQIFCRKMAKFRQEKKNTTRYYQSSTLSTDLLPTFWGSR